MKLTNCKLSTKVQKYKKVTRVLCVWSDGSFCCRFTWNSTQ